MIELTRDWKCEWCGNPEEAAVIKSKRGLIFISLCRTEECEYSNSLRIFGSPEFNPDPSWPWINDFDLDEYFEKLIDNPPAPAILDAGGTR